MLIFLSPVDKYRYIFRAQKYSAVFCQKKKDLLPLFHKMLEG